MYYSNRRRFIKRLLNIAVALLGIGLVRTSDANNVQDSITQPLEQKLAQLFNNQTLHNTHKIQLDLPQYADNNSIIPISISSSLKHAEEVYIFAEKNTDPFIGRFSLHPNLETYLNTEFTLQASGHIIVIIKAGEQYYQQRQAVKVTSIGCAS